MDPIVTLKRVSALTDQERATNLALTERVYPPNEVMTWPGRHLEWTRADWCVRVHRHGELVSYAGVVLREGRRGERHVRIGGIGGVKTHPDHRRHGYAALAIRRAVEFFRQDAAAFALIVCEPALMGYYARLGWNEFTGKLIVSQYGLVTGFSFNRVMTLGVQGTTPLSATVDLCGPPW